MIVFEFAGQPLALTDDEFEAARERGRELLPSPAAPGNTSAEPLVTAELLAKLLDVPQSQVESMARQNRIPSLMIGKYRRFERAAVLAALHTDQHSDDSLGAKNKRNLRAVTVAQPRRGA